VFHFYHNKDVDYRIPDNHTRQDYLDFVEQLPLVNAPDVFGLHANAEIGYFTDTVKEMWEQMVELQPQTGASDKGTSREEFIAQIATGIQGKLPDKFDLDRVRNSMGVVSPTQVVLLQELERWNALVAKMRVTLSELQRALIGEVGMSNELDELARALFNGQIPPSWRRLAPDTRKSLGNWIIHFQRRLDQVLSLFWHYLFFTF
jgi:dynein heavy chain